MDHEHAVSTGLYRGPGGSLWSVEAIHDNADWGSVGQLVLLSAVFFGPAMVLDQIGRRRSGGQADWWKDERLAQHDQPKSGPRAAGFEAFATEALKQMVSSINPGINVLATDGVLHGYWSTAGIDWRDVWREATGRSAGVPPYGIRQYWVAQGPGGSLVPLSVLAFCGSSTRLRIASQPGVDNHTREMLARDADSRVRETARQYRP